MIDSEKLLLEVRFALLGCNYQKIIALLDLEGILREDRENNNTPLIQRENPLLLTELSIKYMTQSRWKDEIACRLRSSDEGERIQNYEFILEHEQGRVAEGTFSLKDQ